MTVNIKNNCKHGIVLNFDDEESVYIQPYGTKTIFRKNSNTMIVLVKRNCESVRNKRVYHLVIETEYRFTDVSDNAFFTVSREKIRCNPNAYYDRLFLWSKNAKCISENHRIISEDKMKQSYKKFERRGKLIGIIILDIDAIIFFLLLGIYLIWRFSWKVACFYFPVVALIIWLANLFAVRLSNMIFRKNIKKEDESEFFTLFKNDYIKDYYADANRKPLFNQIVIN